MLYWGMRLKLFEAEVELVVLRSVGGYHLADILEM